MSATAEQDAAQMLVSAPANVESRTRSRKRPAIIGIAVALIILFSLVTAYLVMNAGQTKQVFVAASTLERGHQIVAQDLTTIDVPVTQKVDAYSRDDAKRVVGQYVTTKLNEGGLVGPSTIGGAAPVDSGTSIVGVALSTAQLPPYPLVSGDHVRIVETPIAQGDPPKQTPASIKATVVTVSSADDKTGATSTVVAVAVDKDRAADLAARAATGRVALILDGEK